MDPRGRAVTVIFFSTAFCQSKKSISVPSLMQGSLQNIYSSYLESPVGMIEITANEESIFSISFLDSDPRNTSTKENDVISKCKQQLKEYFSGVRNEFNISLHLSGTEFQNRVWEMLQTVPLGRTISYLELAKKLGDPKCIRAAGTANGKNPIAVIVPCHRIIGSNNELVGYAGGLWRKRWLLEHESAQQSLF